MSTPMHVHVLLFANLRDMAGSRSLDLDLPEGTTVGELKDGLRRSHPALDRAMDSVVVAVNREFAFDETVLKPSDEIALFPPVSGG